MPYDVIWEDKGLYESTAGGAPWETEIFKSVEAARAWITSKFGISFD